MYLQRYGAWLETADVSSALTPFEVFRKEEGLEEYAKKSPDTKAMASTIRSLINAPAWIPASAEVYHTSANISDYFIVPTIIMPSDLPNRNARAFPLKELTKFSPAIGNVTYKGWIGKPVHVDHKNQDPTKAIGAVIDVAFRPIKNTSLWKVISLLAIDRTKNVPITSAILDGRRPNYSMGALVRGHRCSVCGSTSMIKPGQKTAYEGLRCGTEHASLSRNGEFRTFPTRDGKQTIGFLNVIEPTPFEVSSVGTPAYVSAESNPEHIQYL